MRPFRSLLQSIASLSVPRLLRPSDEGCEVKACTALFLLAASCAFATGQTNEHHSFQPGEIWTDNNHLHINAHGGGVLYHQGKYYWYGEHKVAGRAGNSAQVGVHCYSSIDLYNWTDEGIALKVVENDPASPIAKGCTLERPKVIYNTKTRKFVMWFHLELRGKGYDAALSGVAVSDNAVGPFQFLRAERPDKGAWPVNVLPEHKTRKFNANNATFNGGGASEHPDVINFLGRDYEGGQMARDMNLFVDDDGKAYHIFSSEENSTIHISELSNDYLSHVGRYVRAFPGRYMEGAALCKANGTYYFVASSCTGWTPNAARSASAPSIFGPWTELGNPCVGAGSDRTFESQSTYILPVAGRTNAFIFMANRWKPENPIDGRYVWLPIRFKDGLMVLHWSDSWMLDDFDRMKSNNE